MHLKTKLTKTTKNYSKLLNEETLPHKGSVLRKHRITQLKEQELEKELKDWNNNDSKTVLRKLYSD